MLAKRVIPCLDVDRGRVVKGTNFVNLRDAGDPVEVAARYEKEGADELVFLDICASHEGRDIMLDVVRRTAEQIFMPLTVHDNVRLAAQSREVQQPWNPLRWWHDTRTNTIKNRAVSARVSSAIELSGLQDRRTTIAGAMSHGEQRQLEIAMTLAGEPKVLLLDEPLAGMGPEESERLTALLKALAREHAILLIEHDMDFVFAVADWMTVMTEGCVLAEGRPEAIRANPQVQTAYLGGHA